MKTIYKSYSELPLTLSVPEVAAARGISRAGAYELVRADSFPKITIRKRIIIPKDKFIAWMDKQSEVWD